VPIGAERQLMAAASRGRPQRARILRAAVDVIAERGFAGASVTAVVERAGVSRRTFYAEFDDLDGCVGAVLDETLRHVSALAYGAFDDAGCWRDGLRAALAAVLCFLESEPQLARVAMVESLAGGPVVLAHRERVVSGFRSLVVAQIEGEVPYAWPLAAEGMFASVMGVVHAHLTGPKRGPLTGLLAPLMATLLAPFSDARALEREVERCERLNQEIMRDAEHPPERPSPGGRWPLIGAPALPAMFANPRSRRARECLRFIAEHPHASNRQVAVGIGVDHPSQISRLLSDLEREGVLVKRSQGAGKTNIWRLAALGERVLGVLGEPAGPSSGLVDAPECEEILQPSPGVTGTRT
jgi:AcrR family transcriptional regulator